MDRKKWMIAGGVFLLLWLTGVFRALIYILTVWLGFGGFLVLAFMGLGAWALVYKAGKKGRQQKLNEAAKRRNLEKMLSTYGATPEERAQRLNQSFDAKSGSLTFLIDERFADWHIYVEIGRSLAAMTARERESLRAALLLFNEGAHDSLYNASSSVRGLIYGDGKASVYGWRIRGLDKNRDEALKWLVEGEGVEPSVDTTLRDLGHAIKKHPQNPTLLALGARLLGNGGDLSRSNALLAGTLESLPENTLIVGSDENASGQLRGFAGEGALITVAPPGSGKTQCHVIPNLLLWQGPAVVLDVKGEIFAATSGWRQANVGPVYRFSPLSPDTGHSYNPLAAVSDDPDHIWEDSRFLADMLIVPGGKAKDPFWESRARDIVTAAIAQTVRTRPPEERTMGAVLDILHGVGWDRFILSLKASSDVPTMARAGSSLGEMEAKTRDSVLQTALASVSSWEGARISRATARSDWQPADLRGGANPTIYICINPNEIDSYASMLRVVIAQHIRSLTSKLPDRDGRPILFFLDELPRLRHMPPVEEALEIGRQYGIKLWMFTQSLGQLDTAYENAEGMAGSCAVRMFMNPSLADNTAQKLSDEMGYRESVIDGTRVKRVEPNVLAGPEFKDRIIVMAANAEPATVAKHFAYRDADMAAKMAVPPAEIKREAANA